MESPARSLSFFTPEVKTAEYCPIFFTVSTVNDELDA